jgi:hypothetical protein
MVPTGAGELRTKAQEFLDEIHDESTGQTNLDYIFERLKKADDYRAFQLLLESAYGRPSMRHELEASGEVVFKVEHSDTWRIAEPEEPEFIDAEYEVLEDKREGE